MENDMEIHEKFTEWTVARGVKINGIAAHRFPGSGMGIIATKNHEAGSTLLTVPTKALRTAFTVPASTIKALGPITVHGLLAADLSLDTSPELLPWREVLPSQSSFQTSMPLLWPPDLQALLPSAATSLLKNQQVKLLADWSTTQIAFPDIAYDTYLHNWLLVNTRTFHFTSHARNVRRPSNSDDCMALNPFADYFNHTDGDGCTVTFSAAGYSISTTEPIEEGQELYISYGSHSNDFLLAEYGFILPSNAWDQIYLDDFIMPLLSKKQKVSLEETGFLGKYVLDNEDICHRTQVALRILCIPLGRWQRFVDGLDDGEKDQEAVGELLAQIITTYLSHVERQLVKLETLECSPKRTALIERWIQIRLLLQKKAAQINESS